VKIFDAPLITGGHQRSRCFGLQPRAHVRVSGQGHGPLEVLAGRDHIAVQQIGLPDRLFQRQLLVNQPQCFGAVAGVTIGSHNFINGKNTLGFCRRALCVDQSVFVITRRM
jgi:hypothetical protein